MNLKKAFACCVLGFCLSQSFTAWANPWTHDGITRSLRNVATDPLFILFSAEARPVETLGPLAIAAGAAAYAFGGRKKRENHPKLS